MFSIVQIYEKTAVPSIYRQTLIHGTRLLCFKGQTSFGIQIPNLTLISTVSNDFKIIMNKTSTTSYDIINAELMGN